MSEPAKAVFLSYASQDAEAAKRICEALRAAGVEVWFDQSELVGGDAWDTKIRKQIKECALLIPVISANTQSRTEGYFRLEWRLADQRTHLMAKGRPFLLPVVIDDTRDAEAHVPDSFTEVQWTKLPRGEGAVAFAARVQKLLSGEQGAGSREPAAVGRKVGTNIPEPSAENRRLGRFWWALPIFGVTMALLLLLNEKKPLRQEAPIRSVAPSVAATSPSQELVAKAQQILDQGDELNRETYVLAEELLVKAEQLDVTEASAWILHAQVSSALIGYALDESAVRRESLRTQANRAVQLAPTSLAAQLVECDSLITFGQNVPGIVARLQALAAQHPDNWRVFDLLSEGLRLEGKFTDGLAANERARRLAPDNFLVKGNRLSLLSRNGDWAAAEKELAVMLQGRTSARILAFEVLLKLVWSGDPAGAVAAVQGWPAWFLLEDRGVVHAVLAALWNRNPILALQYVQKYPRDYVRDYMFTGPTAVLSALANEQAGNMEAARADWRVVQQVTERELREKPKEAYALHWKAWALARLGDPASAAPILQQLLEANPFMRNMTRVFGRFGGLALAMGRSDVALAQIAQEPRVTTKAILRLNPVFDALRADPRFQALIESALGPEESKPGGASVHEAANKSVAVLAFANLSDDKANEYFSDGISEELLNVLAKVPGLKVSARTSAFHFKGKDTPIPEIAKQLGVAYVVEGSVRKQGDKVRITAQLIKAADGFHVWSDTFTRDLKDIFAVQDEIAGLIAKNLQLKLGAGNFAGDKSTDVEAWQLYLNGRRAWNLRTPEGYREAATHFQRAIALDVRFARAYAALADVWQLTAIDESSATFSPGWRISPTAVRSRALIDKALEMDPNCPEAYASLGMNLQLGWEDEAADRAYLRAIELNPNYATAHQWFGLSILGEGRIEEALSGLKRAAELDPLSHRILSDYAFVLNVAGRPEQALAMSLRALSLQPGAVQAVLQQARALAVLKRPQEAIALIEGVKTKELSARLRAETLAILAITGQKEAIHRFSADSDASPAAMLKFFSLVALGRTDEALANFAPSVVGHGLGLTEAAFGELLTPIRNDARFQQMIKTSGRAEYYYRAQAWRATHPPIKPVAKP